MRDGRARVRPRARARRSTPPGPLESPEETGIRRAEVDVDTRDARAQDSDELRTQLGGVAPTSRRASSRRTRAWAGSRARRSHRRPVPTRRRSAPRPPLLGAAPTPTPLRSPSHGDTPAGGTAVPTESKKAEPGADRRHRGRRARAGDRRLPDRQGGGGGDEQPAGTSSAPVRRDRHHLPERLGADRRRAPEIPGFEFANPLSVGPTGQPDNRLTTGLVEASGPSLLPASFVKALGADPDRTDTVRLGDLQAYRYRNLDPGGFNPALTLYAVPPTRASATIACTADPAQAAQFLPECERAASTLELEGAKPFDLGLGREYAERLTHARARCRAAVRDSSRL